MDLSAFYEECQKLPDNERQWVDVFYKTVIEVFGENNQSFEEYDKVYRLFYGNSSTLSKAQYYRKRNLVRKLYDWLSAQGSVSEDFCKKVNKLELKDVVSGVELYHYYFKNLDEALNFIALVGSSKNMGRFDDLLNIKSVVILSWYQISLNEICELRKSDLHSDDSTICVGGKRIPIEKKYFDILKRFAELDVHDGFPTHKKQIYMTSHYLMRSARQISLNQNNIQKSLQRFNTIAVEYGKELSVLNLRRNGIFSQVYTSQSTKTPSVLIQELTGCDTAFAFGYKEFYEKWRQFVIGGDEN